MAKKDTQKKSGGHGFGVAALTAAAAAGLYFLYGSKNAAKNRKQVKSWAFKAKGEVIEKMEKYKELKEADYHKIVDTVIDRYKKMKSVNAREAQELANDLKKQWKEIQKEAEKKGPARAQRAGGKKSASSARKTAKKAAKKAAKKTTRKR